MSNLYLMLAGGAGALTFVTTMIALALRRVVPTNEVHIVQSSKKTTSYGKDTAHGNTYYEWPSWLPFFGVNRITLPVSVFALDLQHYEAYDKGRLPFVVDVKAFFRITDSNLAAARVASFKGLTEQLLAVVQGAVRSILASNEIEEIMQGRSKFGHEFTAEVDGQLKEWGVGTVKSIELMDIRDHEASKVIANIMEKKKSHIEMESRTEVAKNKQLAAVAEIDAQRQVDLQKQQAAQMVGLRTIEAEREVELQRQSKAQLVKEQEKLTKEKEMNVLQVQSMRQAEIAKEVSIVQAKQNKETTVLVAEGTKLTAVLHAEANLEAKKRESEGITLEGKARADAERAMLLAPVEAQTTLAKEIGMNEGYQNYLITIRKVEAEQAVGIAQAEALDKAEIKIIANTGNAPAGLKSAGDLFSSKGGTELGAMLQGFANTDIGKKILSLSKD